MNPQIAILIPSFKPNDQLVRLVADLREHCEYPIVIVNDGSGAEHAEIFRAVAALPPITLYEHAINLGKGAALKTGFNQILLSNPDIEAVVTADGDGQHSVEDILKVADFAKANKGQLVLGARTFGEGTPMRSLVGNNVSRWLYRLLLGIKVNDTQTGLRAIPKELMKRSMQISANRYEFETEQLAITSAMGLKIAEVPIRTIYEDNNASSHFNPLFDSARIYFVVFRYALSSLATSAIDFIAFWILISMSIPTISANLGSRGVALMVQYGLLSSFVFKTRSGIWRFGAFIAYVMLTGMVSGIVQVNLMQSLGLSVMVAKMVAESAIFVFNFLFLRDILFARRNHGTQN